MSCLPCQQNFQRAPQAGFQPSSLLNQAHLSGGFSKTTALAGCENLLNPNLLNTFNCIKIKCDNYLFEIPTGLAGTEATVEAIQIGGGKCDSSSSTTESTCTVTKKYKCTKKPKKCESSSSSSSSSSCEDSTDHSSHSCSVQHDDSSSHCSSSTTQTSCSADSSKQGSCQYCKHSNDLFSESEEIPLKQHHSTTTSQVLQIKKHKVKKDVDHKDHKEKKKYYKEVGQPLYSNNNGKDDLDDLTETEVVVKKSHKQTKSIAKKLQKY